MNIKIRRGKLGDALFVRRLAIESVKFTVPSTRRIPLELVRKYTAESLADLEFAIYSPDFSLIIAEDLDIKKPIGYLMLDLNQIESSTGEKQSVIHDLAIKREYWGKFVVDMLMAEAENITQKKKLLYIIGEITADNKRPLIYATRRLGYIVERYQIVKVMD